MRGVICFVALLCLATLAHADVMYVDIDAAGANDGSSWTDAFLDLQDALGIAVAGDEIWVAGGVYYTTTDADQDISFVLGSGIAVYGGFAGGESSIGDRMLGENESVLRGIAAADRLERTLDVLRIANGDSSTVVDGLTVAGGQHGIWIEGGEPRIRDCVITDNSAFSHHGLDWGGGGVFINSGGTAEFDGVEFVGNASDYSGGAIRVDDGNPVKVRNSRFVDNWSSGVGGAVGGGGGYFEDVEFIGNGVNDFGGAVAGTGTFVRVLFRDNQGDLGGGAVSGSGDFLDCVFEGNHGAGGEGGAVYGAGRFVNTRFDSNGSSFGGAVYSPGGGSTFINVEFLNNSAFTGSAVLVAAAPPPYWDTQPPESLEPTQLINVTVAGYGTTPVVQDWASAAVVVRGSDCQVVNSVIWSIADAGSSFAPISVHDAELVTSHSIVQRSGGSQSWDPLFGTDGGGNFDVDPMFADEAAGDLRLAQGSPAIDGGDTGAVPDGITTDLDGNARFTGTAVDMGCYEADGPLSLEDPVPQPRSVDHYLYAAPNPFNPKTTIYLGLPEAGHVGLTIYDLAGRRVKTLVSERLAAGEHKVRWDGRDEGGKQVASGLYLYQVRAGAYVETKRMVLLK